MQTMLIKKLCGLLAIALVIFLAACEPKPYKLKEIPEIDQYCRAAQRLITKTEVPVEVVIHDSFEAFVKSKAIIDETGQPFIQQYGWTDDQGRLTGISCKLKSADHLNLAFGEGSAGPDGKCQEMNQAVFKKIAKHTRSPTYTSITFDPLETVTNDEQPGMTGPDWLAPFSMTYVEDDVLHIATKGFVVDFTDPRYEAAPERFRGVHYCHLISPDYLAALMVGEAPAGAIVGQEVDRSGPAPQGR